MLKVLLPCLPEDKRGAFAVFIRMQELMFTVELLRHSPPGIKMAPAPKGDALFDALLPYCDGAARKRLDQLRQMTRQMEQMKEMMEMVETLRELFPEGMSPEDFDPAQMAGLFQK